MRMVLMLIIMLCYFVKESYRRTYAQAPPIAPAMQRVVTIIQNDVLNPNKAVDKARPAMPTSTTGLRPTASEM